MKQYLKAGVLNSPRGLRGEIRFSCFCDSPEFLVGVNVLYLDDKGEQPLSVKAYRSTIPTITFEGYEDRTTAYSLMGRTVYFDRTDIPLPEGTYYYEDLIGLPAIDVSSGDMLGNIEVVEEGVAYNFFHIKGETDSYIIPDIEEYVPEIHPTQGIKVKLIDGLKLK